MDDEKTKQETKKEKCFICADLLYYRDFQGLWHTCPKCNSVNWNYPWTTDNTTWVSDGMKITIYPCAICGCTDGQHCLTAHTAHDSGNPITHVVCNCPKCRAMY